MSERMSAPQDSPLHLPPVELRHPDFRHPGTSSFYRLDTPVTEIGLVDTPKFMKLVKGTLNAAYKWPSLLDDEHHELWPSSAYDTSALHQLRNNQVNKKYYPRIFHNWAHKVTLPPSVPPEDTVHNINIFQESINDMHSAVQISKMLTRNPDISQRSLQERLKELHEDYHDALSKIDVLPIEYQLIDPEAFRKETVYDLLMINGELGRLAVVSSVGRATRYIRQPTHSTIRASAYAA